MRPSSVRDDRDTPEVPSKLDFLAGLLWQKLHNEIIQDEGEVDRLASHLTDPVLGIQCTFPCHESTKGIEEAAFPASLTTYK